MTGTTFDGLAGLHVRGRSWKRRQKPPLHVTVLEWPDRLVALPTDQSGGQRGGDRLRTEILVNDGGWLDWLPPSSSLYHPATVGSAPCRVDNVLHVASGSRLAWRPRVSLPCRGSHVVQSTELRAEPGAELLYWDGWADGRTSSGERSEFGSITSSLEVVWDGQAVFRERWALTGEAQKSSPLSGFQGACQWHLGVAVGPQSIDDLQLRVQAWRLDGAHAECGELVSGIWIARVLAFRPYSC